MRQITSIEYGEFCMEMTLKPSESSQERLLNFFSGTKEVTQRVLHIIKDMAREAK